MKKQLFVLLFTIGCIPAIIEQEIKQTKDTQIDQDTPTAAQAVRVCKNCRRK